MVYVIAEVGLNHGGSLKRAVEHIHSAKEAGADCVKFQLFRADKLISNKFAPKSYQFFKSYELSFDEIKYLYQESINSNIDFLCSPFDEEAVDFLDSLPVSHFKVASGELTNEALLSRIGSKGKHVYLSTGMATFDEIQWALGILRKAGAEQITLLHCVSIYPTPLEFAKLGVILALKRAFNLPVGYSDHTAGINCALAAVALGATVIEKHFGIYTDNSIPDLACSTDKEGLSCIKRVSEEITLALGNCNGNFEKEISEEEREVAKNARKSIYSTGIKAGEKILPEHIIMLRPEVGIPARHFSQIIGKTVKVDIRPGEALYWQYLE